MMNTNFNSALDKIKAEEALIEKTAYYLHSKLESPSDEKILYYRKRGGIHMKKVFIASLAAVFLVGSIAGGYTYLKTPVAYISLDINPSVELGINAFNKVVSAESFNEDGQAILEGQDIINNNVSEALDQLVNAAADQDFIKEDGTTVIAVTSEANNDDKAVNLQDLSEEAVNNAISKKEVPAIVYKDCSDLSLRTEAKGLGISPGKYKLIKSLQALDPTITVDQFKDAKVSEIMSKAHELINNLEAAKTDSQLNDSQKEAIENLKNVAEKQAAKADAKAALKDIKDQAQSTKTDAKAKAEELRKQAEALLQNTDGMTEAEKAAAKAQAKELKQQAASLVKEAEKQAVSLIKDAAEARKEQASAEAKQPKAGTETNNNEGKTAEGQPQEAKKTEESKETEAKNAEEQKEPSQKQNSDKNQARTTENKQEVT